MNDENINEQLLRTVRERDYAIAENKRWSDRFDEQQKALAAAGLAGVLPSDGITTLAKQRDEARAENTSLRHALTGRTVSCGACEQTTRELARLRAAANERAIAELEEAQRWTENRGKFGVLNLWSTKEGMFAWDHVLGPIISHIETQLATLRAETPAAPQPALSGGVERAIAELERVLMLPGDPYNHGAMVMKHIAALRAEQQAAPVPPPVTPPSFDLVSHLRRQSEWSAVTFGPGDRARGVIDHIRKELSEIQVEHEAGRDTLPEWIDVAILAFDGAWRSGATPEGIVAALAAKQAKNEARKWPDWRTADPNKAIEHDRSGEKPPVTPPADAPSRPSVEALRDRLHVFLRTRCPSADHMGEFVTRLESLLVGIVDALAGRGGAQ